MGRGRKFGYRKGGRKRKRIQSKDKGSDDSDEDYEIEEDVSEDDDNSEESLASSSSEFSEESFDFSAASSSGSYEDQRAVRPKPKKGFVARRKLGANRRKTNISSNRSRDLSDESFDMTVTSFSGSSEDDLMVVRSNTRKQFPGKRKSGIKERRVSISRISDESEDEDADFSEEEDEEFMPDVDDWVDEEEDNQVRKKNGVRNRVIPKKGSSKGRSARKKSKKRKEKKKAATKRQGRLVSRRIVSSDDDFVMEDRVVEEKSKKKGRRRKKRAIVHSDSDFVDSSGSSDYEYTISEEERELIKEAGNNENLTDCFGGSSLAEGMQINGTLTRQQLKMLGMKGKEKANDLQLDLGKQVCGICLSEEREGIVRGTLNSCFHYFCFNCIMEWSKVESRCPVCKRRFITISKPARPDIAIGLRNAVIRVPKRDQVYRPSEEEMRGYLDPYENVVCTECQQGGDDNLMLLCDICDSSAHTYCVGLGREVPEGNWYCEGCKSSELKPANSQVQDYVPDLGTSNSALCAERSAGRRYAEDFDLNLHPCTTSQNSESLPQQLPALGIDLLPSPRYPVGEDLQAVSPMSGGASTVLERRRLRLRIHRLISNNMMSQSSERTNSSRGLPDSGIENDVFIPGIEHARRPESGDSRSTAFEGRAQGSSRSSMFQAESRTYPSQNGDPFHARLSYERNQFNQDLRATSSSVPADEPLHAEHGGINPSLTPLGFEQSSKPVNGPNANISQCMYSERGSSRTAEDAKDQVWTIVKSHLKLLSKDIALGRDTFSDIARQSTHTVLAVCGLKHRRSVAIPTERPSACPHIANEGEQTTLMKGYCPACFHLFVADVVQRIMRMKLAQ